MTKQKLQNVLNNIETQKTMFSKIHNELESRGERMSLLSTTIAEHLDSLIEELKSDISLEEEAKRKKARENARERYNRIVELEGCRDLAIDTVYSRGTDGWNVSDMVMEVKNLLYKMYASGDIMGGKRYYRMYSFLSDFEKLADVEPVCKDHGTSYAIKRRVVQNG